MTRCRWMSRGRGSSGWLGVWRRGRVGGCCWWRSSTLGRVARCSGWCPRRAGWGITAGGASHRGRPCSGGAGAGRLPGAGRGGDGCWAVVVFAGSGDFPARPRRGHRLVEDLIDAAGHGTVGQLEVLVRGLHTMEEVDGPDRHPEEYVSHSWSSPAQWRMRARLDPERGAIVQSAIETIAGVDGIDQAAALVRMAEI